MIKDLIIIGLTLVVISAIIAKMLFEITKAIHAKNDLIVELLEDLKHTNKQAIKAYKRAEMEEVLTRMEIQNQLED